MIPLTVEQVIQEMTRLEMFRSLCPGDVVSWAGERFTVTQDMIDAQYIYGGGDEREPVGILGSMK